MSDLAAAIRMFGGAQQFPIFPADWDKLNSKVRREWAHTPLFGHAINEQGQSCFIRLTLVEAHQRFNAGERIYSRYSAVVKGEWPFSRPPDR